METVRPFFISGFMTELMCHIGQQAVYEEASENMKRLTGTEVSGKQIERVCHYYGQKIEEEEQGLSLKEKETQYEKNELHYVMMDGGMLLTREEGWKEMKLCRIFAHDSIEQISKNRRQVSQSKYIGHLGSHHEFWGKVEQHTDYIQQKIIIADGARWIWKWAEEKCPEARQILDFYHAKEHLCQFAEEQFEVLKQKQDWIAWQSHRLLNNQIDDVIADLEAMKPRGGTACKEKMSLIKYYQANRKRMQYKTYTENGWLIGSGPIEAAHRHVIQQRMKLSGQRWTLKGAQQLANLRMASKSNQWHRVYNAIHNQLPMAA
jgi:hypothetical protein